MSKGYLPTSESRENLVQSQPGSTGTGRSTRTTARRNRSLVKPERSRSRRGLSFGRENFLRDDVAQDHEKKSPFRCWKCTFLACTCCCCSCLLEKCGMKAKQVQEAWREKVALCITIFIFCLALGFLTFGFTTVVCQEKGVTIKYETVATKNNENDRWYIIHGTIYNVPEKYGTHDHSAKNPENPMNTFATKDITVYFPNTPTCDSIGFTYKFSCRAPGSTIEFCHSPSIITPKPDGNNGFDLIGQVAYDWKEIEGTTKFVYNGKVFDLDYYFDQIPAEMENKPFGEDIDAIFRRVKGQDGTRALAAFDPLVLQCLSEWFLAGTLEVKNIGCIATDIVLYVSLVVILSVVLIKFFLAAFYGWYIRLKIRKLEKMTETDNKKMERKASSSTILSTSKFSTR